MASCCDVWGANCIVIFMMCEMKYLAVRLYLCISYGEAGMEAELAKGFDHLLMIEIAIDQMTGKEAIELATSKPCK